MIRGGRIIDGSGNPWFLGDIGVRDGRIARIGRQLSGSAGRAVDATGKVVAPGFIDVHTHIEGDIEKRPGAENFVRMGVTTVVTGNCGGSALPLGPWLDRLERDPLRHQRRLARRSQHRPARRHERRLRPASDR